MKEFNQDRVTVNFINSYNLLQVKNMSDFCRNIGYSVQSFNEIIKGRRNVTVDFLRKYINIYNIDANDLFAEKGIKSEKNEQFVDLNNVQISQLREKINELQGEIIQLQKENINLLKQQATISQINHINTGEKKE